MNIHFACPITSGRDPEPVSRARPARLPEGGHAARAPGRIRQWVTGILLPNAGQIVNIVTI